MCESVVQRHVCRHVGSVQRAAGEQERPVSCSLATLAHASVPCVALSVQLCAADGRVRCILIA